MRIPTFVNRRLLFYLLLGIATIQLFSVILFFVFRDSILQNKLDKKISEFNSEYPATLSIKDAHFTGLSGIELEDICILPEHHDTLLSIHHVQLRLGFFSMIFGHINIKTLFVENSELNIIASDSTDNYSFLLNKQHEDTLKSEKSFSSLADRFSDAIFGKLPGNIMMNDFNVNAEIDSSEIDVHADIIEIADEQFCFPVTVTENDSMNIWYLKGNVSKSKRIAGVTVFPAKKDAVFPFLKNRYGLKIKMDSLSLGLSNNDFIGDVYRLNVNASVYGLLLDHKKISTTEVYMPRTVLECRFNIGDDFIELDSSSSFTYNKLVLNPYLLYQSGNSKKYTFKIHDEFNAQDLFGSLPAGLFTNFENIQTRGNLSLAVDFYVDMQSPDSLIFSAKLLGDDFKILNYGVTDFSMITGPFTHTVYENGMAVASFLVGPDNPDYTAIEDISLPLKEAVIIAENGGTYFQTGYDINSLRLAIIQDIKEKKFVRGGSTIEMQLVKNVFLTRSKTIARKAEELLIVWLIQSGNLCSHNRMFEVYLNIAEWGPGVYGIAQASRFYFNKPPSKLTLPESIFLASILPRPKWFKYSFDKTGNLDPEMNAAYFSSIASLLVERGTISPADTLNLLEMVKLRAESKNLMMKDTSYFDVDEIIRQDKRLRNNGQEMDHQNGVNKNQGDSKNRQQYDKGQSDDNRKRDPLKK